MFVQAYGDSHEALLMFHDMANLLPRSDQQAALHAAAAQALDSAAAAQTLDTAAAAASPLQDYPDLLDNPAKAAEAAGPEGGASEAQGAATPEQAVPEASTLLQGPDAAQATRQQVAGAVGDAGGLWGASAAAETAGEPPAGVALPPTQQVGDLGVSELLAGTSVTAQGGAGTPAQANSRSAEVAMGGAREAASGTVADQVPTSSAHSNPEHALADLGIGGETLRSGVSLGGRVDGRARPAKRRRQGSEAKDAVLDARETVGDVIYWIRQDFRLHDNPALADAASAAAASGGAVHCVYVHSPGTLCAVVQRVLLPMFLF